MPSEPGKQTRRFDPSPSFRFHIKLKIKEDNIASFSECSGLEFEQETFDYREGGVNSRVHRLPGRFKFTNLTLKRGIATDGEMLWNWIEETVKGANSGKVVTHPVTVEFYNVSGTALLRSWVFDNAYPVKWAATALSAEQNSIAIETLTLAHQGMHFAQ